MDNIDLGELGFTAEEVELPIAPFIFKMTCFAFPEQYDVLYKGEICAYVRLRHGTLRCDMPYCGGETVLRHQFEDRRGCFDSDEETNFYLKKIAAILMEKMNLVSQ